MTTKNRTTRKPSTGSRKSLSAQATSTLAASAAITVAETVELPSTFQAALAECAAKRAPKRKKKPARRPAAAVATRQVIPAPQVASHATVLARSWSWLRTKCAEVYRNDAERALARQNPQAVLTAAATQVLANHRPTQKRSTSLVRKKTVQPQGNAMTRAFSWLQTKYTMNTTKRLRVTETVSLGEKRFVSLICVDGREFLIGGGATSVSILASLGPQGANLIPELNVEKAS